MTIDMYGERAAEAMATIREFAKTEYYHWFARNYEGSLEQLIAMLDQAEEKGRQEQAARIAELESRIEFNGDHSQDGIVKRDERIADLERQLAEASAPAVEPKGD